jgi:hypothetical protein
MTASPRATEPAFFFAFAVSPAKLALARFSIFVTLAADAFLQIRHAPRYGASDFSVAHFPLLDGLAPGRTGFLLLQLLLSSLLTAVALGVAPRAITAVAAALYAWQYFSSQLDSYQHHYLVALLLAISVFVPWQRATSPAARQVVSPALRVMLVQLGILYLWAAVAKMESGWLSGATLKSQIATSRVGNLIADTVGFSAMAKLVLVAELFLAFAVWLRPLWPYALLVGLPLHLGITIAGFEIGLFSLLMFALYLLLVPESWVRWIGRRGRWLSDATERTFRRAATTSRAVRGSAALAIVAAAGLTVALTVRVELALVAWATSAAVVVGGTAVHRQGLRPVALAVALAATAGLWAVLDHKTEVVVDYYKYWGSAARRFGSNDEAERAYRGLIRVAPDLGLGHYQLGRLLVRRNDDDGVQALKRAQTLEPTRARAHLEESAYWQKLGDIDLALAAARAGNLAEPASKEAHSRVLALEAPGGVRPRGEGRSSGEARSGSDGSREIDE